MGHSWRVDGDIAPTWSDVLRSLDNTAGLARFAGPGGWNDPDMLEVCAQPRVFACDGMLEVCAQPHVFALWSGGS